MYTTINGWTKASMIQHIKDNFKGKSIDYTRGCLYRGPDGKKCAAGLFIKDEEYDPGMEDKGVLSLRFNKIEFPINSKGMSQLQEIHDLSNENNTLDDMLEWIDTNVQDNEASA